MRYELEQKRDFENRKEIIKEMNTDLTFDDRALDALARKRNLPVDENVVKATSDKLYVEMKKNYEFVDGGGLEVKFWLSYYDGLQDIVKVVYGSEKECERKLDTIHLESINRRWSLRKALEYEENGDIRTKESKTEDENTSMPSFIEDRVARPFEDSNDIPTKNLIKKVEMQIRYPPNQPIYPNVKMEKVIRERKLQAKKNELQAIQNGGLISNESELPISNDNEELTQG